MSADKQYEEVPLKLQTHNKTDEQQPAPVEITPSELSGSEVPEGKLNKEPPVYKKTPSIMTPNQIGLTGGAVAGAAAVGAQKSKSVYDILDTKLSKRPSLQNYANSQLGDRNLNIPLKDFPKVTGYNIPATTPALVQRHIDIISGREATPDTYKEIYKIDPKTGQQVLSHIEKTPGSPAVPPLDPSKLTEYEKNVKYHIKKHGELPLRASIAGYDIAKGLAQLDSPAGYGDIAAGAAIGAAPFIPKTVKGVPVRAIATGLGLIPVGSGAISSATAADLPGAAFDVATGLAGPAGMAITPSELGAGTLRPKREVYKPGMKVLEGSTLPPEERADGGLIGDQVPTNSPSVAQMQKELKSAKKKPAQPKKLTIETLPPGLTKEQFEHLCKGGHVEMPKNFAKGGEAKKRRPA